jgi:DNA-binding phage protein
MTRATVCADCPFALAGEARERLMARMDRGAWIPCRHTASPFVESMSHHDRIAAWEAEEECAGARLWRRDRQLPGDVTGADPIMEDPRHHVIADPVAWVDLLRANVEAVGYAEVARRAGLVRENVWRSFNGRHGSIPGLRTLAKVAAALGLDLVVQPRTNQTTHARN